MAKVTMNSDFPLLGGKLWKTIDVFNVFPSRSSAAEKNSRGATTTNPDTSPEVEVGVAIEHSYQLGYEHLCDLFGR